VNPSTSYRGATGNDKIWGKKYSKIAKLVVKKGLSLIRITFCKGGFRDLIVLQFSSKPVPKTMILDIHNSIPMTTGDVHRVHPWPSSCLPRSGT
jgi:hypothetical protein